MGEHGECPFSSFQSSGEYEVFGNGTSPGKMSVIYDMTDVFLNGVIGGYSKGIFPEDFLTEERFPNLSTLTDGGYFLEQASENLKPILFQNAGILTTLAFGIIFILFSFFGLFIFCCCCGNKKSESPTTSGIKAGILTLSTFLLLLLCSLGCVWFFLGAKVSNGNFETIPEVSTCISI